MTPEHSIICPVFVGREANVEAGRAVLNRAASGNGGIIVIGGEAGIGKSRFLREITGNIAAQEFVLLPGACFESDSAIPYAPLLDLVRTFASNTSAAVAAHTFGAAAAALLRAFPELASVFGNPPAASPVAMYDEKRLLFHAIFTALDSLSHTQPVFITIEDLHWADEASLEFIAFLSRRIGSQRITIALTYRNDEVHRPLQQLLVELDRARIVTEVRLTCLASPELDQMLAAIFEGKAPGAGFAKRLHAITDGNPFFVEETLKTLLSSGALSQGTNGAWGTLTLSTVQAPRTAVEAVRRRLSTLTTAARHVGILAAVTGRRFRICISAKAYRK